LFCAAQTSVKDVSLQSSSSKIQVINLSACSINVVSPWKKFAVDISQVHISANVLRVAIETLSSLTSHVRCRVYFTYWPQYCTMQQSTVLYSKI